jgi:hypothetical protein
VLSHKPSISPDIVGINIRKEIPVIQWADPHLPGPEVTWEKCPIQVQVQVPLFKERESPQNMYLKITVTSDEYQ